MLTKVLVYANCVGVFSSRRIQRQVLEEMLDFNRQNIDASKLSAQTLEILRVRGKEMRRELGRMIETHRRPIR